MRRHQPLSWTTGVIMVVAGLLATPTGAANAVDKPPPPPSARCAAGDLGGTATGGSTVAVSGWIQQCVDAPAEAMFDIVLYYPGTAVLAKSHRYRALPAQTPVTISVDLDGSEGSRPDIGQLAAVCVSRDLRDLVPTACVGIERTGPGQVAVTPIPNTDPVLVVGRWHGERPYDTPGHCGTCV